MYSPSASGGPRAGRAPRPCRRHGVWQWCVLALCVHLVTAPASQAQLLNLQHYSNRDGLPQTQGLALLQDSAGYLWIGTYGGLSRFNGREFKTYTSEDGLPSNAVHTLHADPLGRLVVGTAAGVCIKIEESFDCTGEAEGLPNNRVRDVYFDSDGRAWISTDGGIAVVDRIGGPVIRTYGELTGLPSQIVWQVVRDTSGTLWAATTGGLARLTGSRFESFEPQQIQDARVLLPLASGLLVGGTSTSLFLVTAAGVDSIPVPGLESPAGYSGAVTDSEGVVWLASRNGLVSYDGAVAEYLGIINGFRAGDSYDVIVDAEENIWLGTDAGMTRFVPGPFSGYTVNAGLPHGFVRAVAEDASGQLWVGTRGGVAIRQGDRFIRATKPGELPDERVYALAGMPDGRMFIGTSRGLAVWQQGVRRVYRERDGLPSAAIRSIMPDPAGGVWIGTAAGVVRLESNRIVSLGPYHPLSVESVASMAYDQDGRLWLSRVSGGVFVLDGSQITGLGAADGLTDQTVWSIQVDTHGAVWIGTNGDGVFRVDGDVITQFTTRDGMTNNFVWQVVTDSEGSVWLYTNQGLDRYIGGSFVSYGVDDGLLGLEGAVNAGIQTSDGTLWFGSGLGLLRYSSNEEETNYVAPPVFVESVTREGHGELVDGEELPPGHGVVRISFAALSLRVPASVSYTFRLLKNGSEATWSDRTTVSSVSFAQLSPGSYEFQVVGFNNDGLRSLEPASFTFTILPPFWGTVWFRVLALAVLIWAVWGAQVLRTRKLQAEKQRLSLKVEERTEELRHRNADLVVARDAADAARCAKSRFLASMSHEIRTPMNGVLGMAQLLLETKLTAQQREHAEIIQSSGGSLLGILNDILDFSKIEAGKMAIEPLPFDLMLTCSEVAGLLAGKADEKGVEVVFRYAPDAPRHLVADPGRIRQILTNLLSNAIKFTSKGHVLIDVECVDDSSDDALLRISVHDTGIGLDEETITRLFQAFHQADASTVRQYGGTGLGLAICKQLVELMDGEIGVESEPGIGSTFWFELRLPKSEVVPRNLCNDCGALSGVRVLVADDIEVNRRILTEALTGWDMRPVVAADGLEALREMREACAQDDPFRLAVLDYHMPGMDGMELAGEIKGDPSLADTRLVLLTSSSMRGDGSGAKEVGFAGYLGKPARMDTIRDVLTAVLTDLDPEATPLVTRHTIAEARAAGDLIPPVAHAFAGEGMRVLMAEDNRVNQIVLSKMLEALGCDVEIVENGQEAVETWAESSFAIVLMDCQMPVLDGFGATALIREQEDAAHRIPIIAVTANAMKGDKENCIAAGMDDYISKPIEKEALIAVLQRWSGPQAGAVILKG